MEFLAGKKILFIASTGGHLAQLALLAKRINPSLDSLWVTFESDQSRSVLSKYRVRYIDYIPPRGYREMVSSVTDFNDILRERFDAVVSTGAGVAAYPLISAARFKRIPTFYIESVSRFDGPSRTGRLLRLVPGIQLRTQHSSWSDSRWKFEFSVLDIISDHSSVVGDSSAPRSIFVTLGTIKPYRFDRLIDSVLEAIASLNPRPDMTWQVGATSRDDLPGRVCEHVSAEEFDNLVSKADLTITHAGVGSLLRLVELGASTLVLPRKAALGEHVDDHQAQVANYLANRRIVWLPGSDRITQQDIEAARRIRLKVNK
ncbi:hypothetical protein BJF87_24060 [Gordonia sp. CNJ-863]|nr:hypothetical protein BJF87_24060 [Gordonia sp. CNJ-863]